MRTRFYTFSILDHKARWRASLWIIVITSLFGILNTTVFGRPEREVTYEAFAVLVGSTIASSAWYALSSLRYRYMTLARQMYHKRDSAIVSKVREDNELTNDPWEIGQVLVLTFSRV